ncbi:MAG: Periplasmic sensor signal transduction histidine [Prolixibacteraceae bacterium]|nr:MAG: Periplasmic sensor signal transduction histidine [Prolixibacteraceae bacterium]
MKRNINITLLVVFFFLAFIFSASAQESKDTTNAQINGLPQAMKNPVIFAIESTDLRFMERGSSKLTIDLKDLWVLQQDTPTNSKIDNKPRSPIFLGVQLNTYLPKVYGPEVQSYTKTFSSYNISDSTEATIIALGITSENVQDYKYHVVENDSIEIIPWSPIPQIDKNYGLKEEFEKRFKRNPPFKPVITYANLGTFNSPGKQLLIEVVNSKDYSIRDGIILDWKVNFKPIVTQIIVSTKRNYFNLNFSELNRNYATDFDPQTGMPINLAFPLDSISRFQFTFTNHVTVPYKMSLIKSTKTETDTTRIDFYFLEEEFNFNSQHFNTPGNYELVIEPVLSGFAKIKEDQKLRFKFQVLPPPLKAKTFSFIQVAGWGSVILLLLALVFTGNYIFNKRKLLKARQQKELTRLKLKSIQSQLNPHFMFNALSSIQNLMNKSDIEGANRYLGKFSGLTRKVLDSSDAELISLEDELKILEDYIQMEQLRFGFIYEIKTGENINTSNIEVPAMLLQPFVENAVKHGVSALNKDGKIRILASRVQNDIILLVEDNGTGFREESINGNSKGIKLVKERIALLNQSFGSETLELKINSGESGTTVILKLKNWV